MRYLRKANQVRCGGWEMSKVQNYTIIGGLLGFVAWLGQYVFGEQFFLALVTIAFTACAGATLAVLTKDKGE